MYSDCGGRTRFHDYSVIPAHRLLARLAAESGAASVFVIGHCTWFLFRELERCGITAGGVVHSCGRSAEGHLRLDEQGRPAGLIQFPCNGLPLAAGEFDLSILSFALRGSVEESFKLLDEALRVSPRLFALDLGMPERNLDYLAHFFVRLAELLAGRRRYAAYGQYMRLGALEGLIGRYRLERGVKVVWRRQMLFNTTLLMQLER